MSASVAVYRNIYTEDRFKQAYGSEDDAKGGARLRERLTGTCRCSRRACIHLVKDRVPIISWLPRYRLRKWILGDTVAGLTVGVLHIPQGKSQTVGRIASFNLTTITNSNSTLFDKDTSTLGDTTFYTKYKLNNIKLVFC